MIDIEFPFHSLQRERFRSGELVKEWSLKYPQLFDDHDVRIANNQLHYHFFEWLGAVLIYESTGSLSLIEKYETKLHKRKFETFKEVVPTRVFDYVLNNRTGVPDLFVYSPDKRDWFFCEVKGLTDRLQPIQIKRIKELENLSQKQVKVLMFKELSL